MPPSHDRTILMSLRYWFSRCK